MDKPQPRSSQRLNPTITDRVCLVTREPDPFTPPAFIIHWRGEFFAGMADAGLLRAELSAFNCRVEPNGMPALETALTVVPVWFPLARWQLPKSLLTS